MKYRNALPPNAAFIFRILDFNAAFNPLFFPDTLRLKMLHIIIILTIIFITAAFKIKKKIMLKI
ncbi:hypothetical protein BpHYR1_006101 [Brachionus plicatilis]|uniref:Uncharacterized protein n=1 Tax=Brachionus plicatilis TaxID=10195 RepID=A0A3M7SFX6_BRAPC|nr:hypothetical protein BpHYR1_006101 [Brachionus plicatilis]